MTLPYKNSGNENNPDILLPEDMFDSDGNR